MSLSSNAKYISEVELLDALLRISEFAPFRIQCCEDPNYFPDGYTAELSHSTAGAYSLLSLKATLKQNIIKAAVEIEQDALLKALEEGEALLAQVEHPPHPWA